VSRFFVSLASLALTFFRDIPLPLVSSGCENSGNLRELALNRMRDFGAECRDVRFREVGVRLGSLFQDDDIDVLTDSRDSPQSSARFGGAFEKGLYSQRRLGNIPII
jgi:hypothetical protein